MKKLLLGAIALAAISAARVTHAAEATAETATDAAASRFDGEEETVAVDFALQDQNPVSVSRRAEHTTYDTRVDGRNKALIVEFYFHDCGYCQQNEPNVERLTQAHPDNVVQVSVDCDARKYASWLRRFEPTHPVLFGCDRELAQDLGVRGYPTTVVLNAAHEEVWRTTGVWSAATYRRLESFLQ